MFSEILQLRNFLVNPSKNLKITDAGMNLGKIREAHFRYGPTRDFYPLREILILIITAIIMIIKIIIEKVITVIVAIKIIKVLLLIIAIEVVIQITFYSLKLFKTTMICK